MGHLMLQSVSVTEKIYAEAIMGRVTAYQPTPRVQQIAQQIMQLTPQEISQLVKLTPVLRQLAPAQGVCYEVQGQDVREQVLKELTGLGDDYRPMRDDDPFIGGLSVREYMALSDQERERLWTEQHRMEIDDFEERDVRPDAQVSAR